MTCWLFGTGRKYCTFKSNFEDKTKTCDPSLWSVGAQSPADELKFLMKPNENCCVCVCLGLHYGKESIRSSGGAELHNFISSGFVTLGRGHPKGKAPFSFLTLGDWINCSYLCCIHSNVPPVITNNTADGGGMFPDSISLSKQITWTPASVFCN